MGATGPAVQLAEAEVAVGLKWAHAKLLGTGLPEIRRLCSRGDLAQEAESESQVALLAPIARKIQGLVG